MPAVPSVLVLASDIHDRFVPVADLERSGYDVQGVVGCNHLLQQALRGAPDAVVAWQPQVDPALFTTVSQLQSLSPCPVLAFTNEVQVEAFERALQSGISAWVVQGYAPHRLRPLLLQAQARFRQEQAARDALSALNRRYEERTLVDRAKGVLMRARQLDEDGAFKLLRQTSMQSKQRIGQVAQQVVDISRDAEAVNRAGQLRMLSQRLVKLHALRLAQTSAGESQALQADSLRRAREQLGSLRRSLSAPTFGDLVDQVDDGFARLDAALAEPLTAVSLAAVDEAAERWLSQADRLTNALEAAQQSVPLRIVNLAGRQRMLSQRLAKQALIRALVGEAPHPDDSATAFEQALKTLEELPLSNPRIVALLADARREWLRMRHALSQPDSASGRETIAGCSETLLQLFELLTEGYEHAMQMLAGHASPTYAVSRPVN